MFGPPGNDGRFIVGRCLYCRLQFLDYVINTFLSLVYIGRCQCLFFCPFSFGHCFVCPSSSRLHLYFFSCVYSLSISSWHAYLLCVCFVDRCLSFCPFSFGQCVFCSSLIYGLWWPIQTLLLLIYTNFSLIFNL